LGSHRHGLAAEFAQEQGWGTNEEERTVPPDAELTTRGGTDYEYGAQDFGDLPENEQGVEPSPESIEFLTGQNRKES
jgi:hypothetical protein